MRALGPEFDEFVAASSAGLLRTAFLLTGDRGHAEDLLQTALAFRGRHRQRPGRLGDLRDRPAGST